MRWTVLLLLVAACASSSDKPERPDLEVTAFQETVGKRLYFRLREGQISEAAVTIKVDAGTLRDQVRSSNLRNVSVFWEKGNDKLTCRYPFGQEAEFDWVEDTPLSDVFVYTFFSGHGASVTTRIGRGAPMVPRLMLLVTLSKAHLPAELHWEGREPRHIVRESSRLLVNLPQNDNHVLLTGDWNVALRTKKGTWNFLVGVDPDGTPTASTGFVRREKYTVTHVEER